MSFFAFLAFALAVVREVSHSICLPITSPPFIVFKASEISEVMFHILFRFRLFVKSNSLPEGLSPEGLSLTVTRNCGKQLNSKEENGLFPFTSASGSQFLPSIERCRHFAVKKIGYL